MGGVSVSKRLEGLDWGYFVASGEAKSTLKFALLK